MFSNREDAKKAGWYSRRHQDAEAAQAAGKKRREQCGKEGRKLRADARASVRALRTPEQQLLVLRDRVGPDGARKERRRLA